MASKELNELRSLARKRHQAATRKVSRLKAGGAVIAGTANDPRRNLADVSKMTTREAKAYIRRLDTFNSRETQFVPGARGAVLQGKLWAEHQKLQGQLNAEKRAGLSTIKDLFIPHTGMTIGERVAMSTPNHPVTHPPASYAPHLQFSTSSRGIPNDEALKKLIKDLKSQVNGKFFKRKAKYQRVAADKIVDGISNTSLADKYKTLSPAEFNILWNYTDFARITSLDYVNRKNVLHDQKELAWYDERMDVQIREANQLIDEVKALGLDKPKQPTTKGKRGK